MQATHSGVRKVPMYSEEGICTVRVSNILVVSDAGMSLMSVTALVKTNIGVLFMPGYGVLFELPESIEILEYGKKHRDGLCVIASDGTTPVPGNSTLNVGELKAMMAKLWSTWDSSVRLNVRTEGCAAASGVTNPTNEASLSATNTKNMSSYGISISVTPFRSHPGDTSCSPPHSFMWSARSVTERIS